MTPVRVAGVDDADLLGRLLWDFDTEFDADPDPVDLLVSRFARVLTDPRALALVAGERSGFAFLTLRPTVWHDGPLAQLEELYVAPPHRGRGTGTALISTARALLRERGCPELHIDVDEVDAGARRFYERHGFVNVEREADGRMLCYVGTTRDHRA